LKCRPQVRSQKHHPGPDCGILLREERVLTHMGTEEEKDLEAWVLDSGATNHMSGVRAIFKDPNTVVHGIVHFGDDSEVRIEGHGTVIFLCKDGEWRSFVGVYYIPRLTTNIVSISA
jgi:hypothetical protein